MLFTEHAQFPSLLIKESVLANSPYLESIRHVMRTKHYSIQTEKTYLLWIKRFILFSGKRHPKELGEQ